MLGQAYKNIDTDTEKLQINIDLFHINDRSKLSYKISLLSIAYFS